MRPFGRVRQVGRVGRVRQVRPVQSLRFVRPLPSLSFSHPFIRLILTKETRITIRPADDQFPATAKSKVFRYFLDNIKLYGDGNAAVGELADENAPVVYYNLQGVKVANPENGVFIRRQGSKVTKVVM